VAIHRRTVRGPVVERAPAEDPAVVVPPEEITPSPQEAAAPPREELAPAPEEILAPALSPPPPQRRREARSPMAPPPLGEQDLLRTALARLRIERDPAGSLDALDEQAERFPGGALAPEALALRAEALVQLGLRREALRVLDDPLLAVMPGAEARRALHGELLAALGRWREARRDFDRVIAAGSDQHALERALWGRAAAHEQLGDPVGERADLRQYMRRFPRGRFSARAAAALEQMP
jgi:tetratricopeptide (TPR) repeat protein